MPHNLRLASRVLETKPIPQSKCAGKLQKKLIYAFDLSLASWPSAMYGLVDAAHPPLAEASSSAAAAAANQVDLASQDAAKLLLGNLWRADDVYFEAVKADDGRYDVSFVSPAVERLLGVPPAVALVAWRGCADAVSGGVHSQARFHVAAALDQNTPSEHASRPPASRLDAPRMRRGWTATHAAASTVRAVRLEIRAGRATVCHTACARPQLTQACRLAPGRVPAASAWQQRRLRRAFRCTSRDLVSSFLYFRLTHAPTGR